MSEPDALPVALLFEVGQRLADLNYFSSEQASDLTIIKRGLKSFQTRHNLPVTGDCDPATLRLLFTPQRCGLPDFIQTSAKTCKWPSLRIKWYFRVTLPGLRASEANAAYEQALADWAAVCPFEFERVTDPRKANINVTSGRGRAYYFDGLGGTLGWSQMPCNASSSTQLKQMYDQDEIWSYDMARAVFCHEIGHALGLPHDAEDSLMAEFYNPKIITPQEKDIAAINQRYSKLVSKRKQ